MIWGYGRGTKTQETEGLRSGPKRALSKVLKPTPGCVNLSAASVPPGRLDPGQGLAGPDRGQNRRFIVAAPLNCYSSAISSGFGAEFIRILYLSFWQDSPGLDESCFFHLYNGLVKALWFVKMVLRHNV